MTHFLTEEEVLEIHRHILFNVPIPDIAAAFDISPAAAWCIKTGKSWGYLTGLKRNSPLKQLTNGIEAREIPGYKNIWITKKGVVIRLRHGKLKIVKHGSSKGYVTVAVRTPNEKRIPNRFLHRLLCFTFKPETYFEGALCRHLDDNHLNNDLDNLEWGTDQHNSDDKKRNGNQHRGTRTASARLTEPQVLQIRDLYQNGNLNQLEIAEMFGVSSGCIFSVVHRQSWAWLS